MNESQQLMQLLSIRFSEIKDACTNLERLVSATTVNKSQIQVELSKLKNELRLVEVSIPGFRLLTAFQELDANITPEELYILIFFNTRAFQNKAYKKDISAIIEFISAIRASISLWETSVFPHITTTATSTVRSNPRIIPPDETEPFEWDVFISHATEDKHSFVQSLADRLEAEDVRVWYDSFTLKVGDSLRQSIEFGLQNSRYGIVVLSPAFFGKDWPQRELTVLLSRDSRNNKVILPIWLNLDREQVAQYFPLLADVVACKANRGVDQVVSDLIAVLKPA